MSLESRIQKLEKDAQIDVPSNARLYDGDGIHVDAVIVKMPGAQTYGEALLADGSARPIAPAPIWTLEGIIRRVATRTRERKEDTEKSHTSIELPEGVLFLRVGGRECFYEIVNRAQRRRQAGGDNVTVMAADLCFRGLPGGHSNRKCTY